MWWGIFVLCSPVLEASASGWGYAMIVYGFVNVNYHSFYMGFDNCSGPVLTMLILLFLSGFPTAEGDNQKRFLKTRK